MKKLIIKKPQKKKPISGKLIFCSFLAVSLFVIWLGSYTANKKTDNAIDKPVSITESQPSEPLMPIADEQKLNDEESVINEITQSFENPTQDTMSLPTPKGDEKQVITYINLPVSGDIIKEFSDSELIYSRTMADYRTHPGIDIRSEIGQKVISPQNGRISEISKDEQLGYTITIDHGNMISKISNLSSKIDVKVGDKINLGQSIAIVGDSAEYEIADEPHIHYELIVNGVNVNPLEYVN